MAMLEVKDLEVYYGVIQAIKGISFEVNKGEVIALIGANGAGKTTTIKLLTGQLHSDAGEVTVLGKDPFSPEIRQQIGIMSDMSGLYEKMTVYENLDIFADIYGVKNKKKKIKEKHDEQVVVNEQNPVLKALLFLFDILSRIFNILFYLGIIILCSIGATYLANKFGIINIF